MYVWVGVGVVGLVGGCQPGETHFNIVDYRQAGVSEAYFQSFDECYYCRDAWGNLEVVAVHRTEAANGLAMTQLVYVGTNWKMDPGRTRAESTMINATVSYWIVSGPVGASFEGSGFVSLRENRQRTALVGRLESSSLSPQRRLGAAERLFERADVSGEIVAKRNKAKVVTLLNKMRRLFGPLPRYTPPVENADLR